LVDPRWKVRSGGPVERPCMPKKILAVDDERHIVRLIQMNLERQGYTVIAAYDGREAVQKVETEYPDLVIMDVTMPHMDGFEALRRIKSDPLTRDIPVIMLTVKSQDADVFYAIDAGADLYLTKPINPAELLTFVQRVLGDETE
jgi:two-component system alkaline phosphatase synthesis response regulator PhoP